VCKNQSIFFFPFAGKRFALLEAKMGLAKILDAYEVTPSEKTEDPITLNPKSFMITPANGLWVKFSKLPQES
jgi:cytochrome P450 family 6